MKTPEPMNQSTQSSELPGTGTTQDPSAMRKALNNLALLAISGLSMLLLVAAPLQRAQAQCNTDVSGPVNLTVNFSSNTAILNQAALAGVVNPVDGTGCASCLLWIRRPTDGNWVSSLTLSCEDPTAFGPGTYRVKANPVDPDSDPTCNSAEVDVIITFNDVTDPVIVDEDETVSGGSQPGFDNSSIDISIPVTTSHQLISDVNLTINFTHTRVQEGRIQLIDPSGTLVATLYNFGSCSGSGTYSVTFDDEGSAFNCANLSSGNRMQSSNTSLSLFDGINPNGTWTLRLSDNVGGDLFTVISWDLTFNEYVPECGSVYSLNTGSNYRVLQGSNTQSTGASLGDCSSQLAFNMFTLLDNCDLATLDVTFTAPNPTQTPNTLPSNLSFTGNATIDGLAGDPFNWTFHSSSTGGVGLTLVTFTLTDEAGRTSTCSFDVQVTDNEDPNINCPANVTKGTEAPACTWEASGLGMTETGWTLAPSAGTYNDNCDVVSLTYSISGATSGAGSDDVNGIEFAKGVSTVTYEVEDANGNTRDCSFTVTVNDDDAPSITCPANQTRNTSDDGLGNCTYVASGVEFDFLLATDNCPGATVSNDYDGTSSLAGSSFNRGVTTIEWTVTDAAGNTDVCTFTVTVVDDESPEFDISGSCPGDVTLPALTDGCENIVTWSRPDQFDWVDNCDASNLLEVTEAISDPTVQAAINNNFPYDDAAPSTPITNFPVGVTTITYTVRDLSNNTTSCSFTVTIEDTQAPSITCGGDQTIGTICLASLIPDYTGNVASVDENCPGFTITQSPAAGSTLESIFDPAIPQNGDFFTVTLTVTDGAGLTGDCTFNVTLSDNDLPVPTVAILPVIEPATTLATDCGSFMLCAPTATDCNGTIIYGTATITGSTFDPDGCGAGVPGYLLNVPNNYSILWTYDDGLGNIVTQTQQVNTFDDTTPPIIACPNDIVVNADPGVCTATGISGATITEVFPTVAPYLDAADQPAPGQVIDNCGVAIISWATSGGDADFTNDPGAATFDLGPNTVFVNVADFEGNVSSCSFIVEVVDAQTPTFTCPTSPITLLTGSAGDDIPGDCGYTLGASDLSLDPSALMDNCPGAITTSFSVTAVNGSFVSGGSTSTLSGSTFQADLLGAGEFNISWTVTDANGNNGAPCILNVIVTDDEEPTIECPTSPIVRTTSQDGIPGDCFYTASLGEMDPTNAIDNCNAFGLSNDENGSFTLNGYNFAHDVYSINWTLVDAQGNSSTCPITVIIEDDEAPVNNYCPDDITLVNILGNCDNDVSWLRPHDLDWDDNCDASADLSVIEEISDPGVQAAIDLNYPYNEDISGSVPLTSFPVGVTTITYTATDASGNTSVCDFTVTILDNEAPSITCPSDQILPTICATGVVPDYRPLATNVQDNCPASIIITQDPAPGTPLNLVPGLTPADGESFTVTLTVTDGLPNGLSDACTFAVTLDEQNLPVPNVALLAPASSTCSVLDLAAPTANDCGNTINGVPNQGTLIQFAPPIYRFTTGIYNVIWTYVGASGNTIQTQQITVTDDNISPNAVCQPLSVNLSSTAPGSVSVSAASFDDGSTDNCVIAGFEFAVNGGAFAAFQSFGCDEVGTHSVELKVSDASGNETVCNTTLTIQDITSPTIVGGCPSNLSIGTSSNGNYDCFGLLDLTAPATLDNCDIAQYTLTVTQPDLSVLTFDLLADPSVSNDIQAGVSAAVLFVQDEHGLTNSCSFTVTVTDDQTPTITCAPSGSRNTSANVPGDCQYVIQGTEFDPLTFSDNCPGVTVTNDLTGTSTLAGEELPVGIYSITWTVEDAQGLQSQCAMAIQVIDDELPAVTFCQPNSVQTATSGTCNALVTWLPTYGFDIDENCDIASLEESISDPSVVPVYPYFPNGPYPPFLQNQALFPVGTTTISYTVVDVNGNSSVCSFTVQVTDDEAPVIVCPPNQILNTICATGAVPNYTGLINSLTDNCPGSVILTQSPAAGTPLSSVPGLTPLDGESFIVTLTATDGNPAGLNSNCSFQVTLNDVNLPVPTVASLPKLTSNCEGLIVSPPTASDCGNTIVGIPDKGIQISFNPPQYLFPIGLYTVIWTYIGTNGSTQQAQQIEVTTDIIPPVVVCKNATVVLLPNGTATINVATVTTSITDNCGVASTSVVPSNFTCAQVGPNTVTVTALDAKGNSGSCTATVTIQDITAPTFNIASSTVSASCDNIPASPTVTPSDACGVASFTNTVSSTKGGNASNCNFYNYTITRTWRATDVNGNSATVTQTINVSDNAAPAWTTAMPDTVKTVTNAFNCQGQVVLIIDALKVGDNCAAFNNLTITHVKSIGGSGGANASGLYPLGNTNVTFTVTDPCGNSTVRTVVVVVEDKTLPTPVCVNGITLPLNPQGELVIPAQIIDKGSYDNCLTPFSTSDISLSVFPDSFDCSDAGKTVTVILTVTDLAGNTATCPASVTIIDNTPPSIISCAPDVTVDCSAATDTATLGVPLINDPCGTTLSHTDNLVQVGGAICRRIDRTWRVTDASGNTLQCTQRINITDNLIPIFTSALPADVTIQCGSPIPPPVTVIASDNCGTPISNFTVQTSKTSNLSCTDYAYVITRRWQATDACGNTNLHTQRVTVRDTLAPVISGLPDSLILYTNDFNADSCTVPVSMVALVDDCQPDSVIAVVNNSPIGTGNSSASGSYSAGVYSITFVATDKCGNSSSKTVYLEVIDNSTPTAVCFKNLNVALNSQGFAVLTPDQVNDMSHDNCTLMDDLLLELSQDSFDCTMLGTDTITLTVTDEAGNVNSCESIITVSAGAGQEINTSVVWDDETFAGAKDGAIDITVSGGSGNFSYLWTPGGASTQDINNLSSGIYTLEITDLVTGCMKTVSVFVGIAGQPIDTISGRIVTPLGLPVGQVTMTMTGSQTGSVVTGNDGRYQFTVPSGSTVTITPTKSINPYNGVSALDFAIIQQHILGINLLSSPWGRIAADENGNNAINGIDIAQYQTALLTPLATFVNASSWVFVDSAYTFPNPQQPWSSAWPASITFTNISGNKPNSNFVGVKMGDVNNTANPLALKDDEGPGEVRSSNDVELIVPEMDLKAGERVSVPVYASNFRDLLAYQFSWSFDNQTLRFRGVASAALKGVSQGQFGDQHLESGTIPTIWFQSTPTSVEENQPLYFLEFDVIRDGKVSKSLSLEGGHLGRVAYDQGHEEIGINLNFSGVEDGDTDLAFRLIGNRPNPFSDITNLEFILPEASEVTITITDMAGRAVHVIQTSGIQGHNSVPLTTEQLPAQGMFLYILKAGDHQAIGKMSYQH